VLVLVVLFLSHTLYSLLDICTIIDIVGIINRPARVYIVIPIRVAAIQITIMQIPPCHTIRIHYIVHLIINMLQSFLL
jgi:hypothetical protein